MSPSTTALVARARELLAQGTNLENALTRAIAAAEADEKFVSSVSVDPAVILAALIAAHTEKRDFSNFVAVALAEYSQQAGAPAPELAEFFAKVQAAVAVSPRILPELEKRLRATARTAKAKPAVAA